MAKIIKNNTSMDIELFDVGVVITPTEEFEIPPSEYGLWAGSEDIIPYINSGNFTINNGTEDLSASLGIALIKSNIAFRVGFNNISNGFVSEDTQSAIEEARNYPSITSASVDDTWVWWRDGKGVNKWMKQYNNHVESSEKAPIMAPFGGKIIYLSMINKKNNANGEIKIYKNGILIYTWLISNKRWAKKTSGLSALAFSSNDKISVFIAKSDGTNLEKTQIIMGVKYLDFDLEDTGGSTL